MKRRYWIYLFLFLLTVVNYVDRVALSIASSQISKEFSLSPVMLGYLFSSFLWLYFIALIPMGLLVDMYGTKRLNAWGIGFWSLATALTAATGGFVSLLVTRLLMGLGESTSYPAGGRVLREWAPASERGIATSVFHAGSLLGPAIGAIGLSWVVTTYGWRAAFLVAASMGLVWLAAWLIWFRQPGDAKWLSAEERKYILESRDAFGTSKAPEPERLGFEALVRSKTIWAIAFAHGCAVYATYLFLTWMPSYLQAEKGMSITRSGFFTAFPYAGAAVLGVLVGICSDRYLRNKKISDGNRRVVVAACLVLSALILLIPTVNELWLVMTLLTLSLTGCTAAVASNLSLVNDLLPSKKDSGTAIAMISTGGNLFGLMAPIATGYVVSMTHSYHAGFVITGILVLAAAAATLMLTRGPITVTEATSDVCTTRNA
ncbi:ACS family glucarate transporter-like MFS transporter [Paraburkholderia sp. BL23I1N1]|uniref:MFS transporter n=1 Tax=Paraburkholderia sp. BL23I1N1 TaxID=1938802 RepID=UPI000E76507B|nr:MFS transporter [Paraburkholderia sp. BL23I1N1]RKE25200.1 ACS family glucarate transporter-like MFS transporter [Paraburkholderia sp. BL23I1N1]